MHLLRGALIVKASVGSTPNKGDDISIAASINRIPAMIPPATRMMRPAIGRRPSAPSQ